MVYGWKPCIHRCLPFSPSPKATSKAAGQALAALIISPPSSSIRCRKALVNIPQSRPSLVSLPAEATALSLPGWSPAPHHSPQGPPAPHTPLPHAVFLVNLSMIGHFPLPRKPSLASFMRLILPRSPPFRMPGLQGLRVLRALRGSVPAR